MVSRPAADVLVGLGLVLAVLACFRRRSGGATVVDDSQLEVAADSKMARIPSFSVESRLGELEIIDTFAPADGDAEAPSDSLCAGETRRPRGGARTSRKHGAHILVDDDVMGDDEMGAATQRRRRGRSGLIGGRRDADSVREGSRAALTSSDSPTWDQQSPSDLWEEYEDGLMDGEDLELDLVEFAD